MVSKKINKKAIFFTILALAMISLFLVSYTFYSMVQNRESIQRRIMTMNNFVFSMEKDLPRKLYISGFRILFLFGKRSAETGRYTDDVRLRFNNVFFNCTFDERLNCTDNESMGELMEHATFADIVEDFSDNAKLINANANLTNPRITITQEDPWSVKIALNADLFIEDRTHLAVWNKTAEIVTYIPIENFEDPIYVIETRGKVSNKVRKTIYQPFVTGNDVSKLKLHLNGSFYISSASAPSFLDRLEGKMSADANGNGIESLVNLDRLSAQDVDIEEKSLVDYIYFSENNPQQYKIAGMQDWFRLDNENDHLNAYGVGALATPT